MILKGLSPLSVFSDISAPGGSVSKQQQQQQQDSDRLKPLLSSCIRVLQLPAVKLSFKLLGSCF